jgi:hypothetical protein
MAITLTREQRDTFRAQLEPLFQARSVTQLAALAEDEEFLEDARRFYADLEGEHGESYTLTMPRERLEHLLTRMLSDSERELANVELEPPESVHRMLVDHYGMDEERLGEDLARYRDEARISADESLDLRSECLALLEALRAEGKR